MSTHSQILFIDHPRGLFGRAAPLFCTDAELQRERDLHRHRSLPQLVLLRLQRKPRLRSSKRHRQHCYLKPSKFWRHQ